MYLGVIVNPVELVHLPSEKQARKWLRKNKSGRVMIVNDKPTKLELEKIWSGNHKLSEAECKLKWYERNKEGILDGQTTGSETVTRGEDPERVNWVPNA